MKVAPKSRSEFLIDDELCYGFRFCREHEHTDRWRTQCMLFRVVLGTGMRVSEIVNTLVPEDIDLKGFINIRKEHSKVKRDRTVCVSPELKPYFLVWLQRIPVPGPLFPRPRLNLIGEQTVHTKNGTSWVRKPTPQAQSRAPYSRFDLGRMWDSILIAADIGIRDGKPLSIHKGRHTWATWELASRRLDITEVQAQLGHITPTMTLGFYSHAVIEMMYLKDKTPRWWAEALAKEGLADGVIQLASKTRSGSSAAF